MKNEVLHKEIDLIQGVIQRISGNSFLLKGWLISLITVILAFSKDSIMIANLTAFGMFLCLAVVIFWYMDAFFLHKERCFRKLYEWVIANRETSDEHLYSLDYKRFQSAVKKPWQLMASSTLLPIYGLTLLVLIGFGVVKSF